MHQPSEYQPPDDIWEVNRRLRVDEPLDGENDPRWVDTGASRGEYSHHRLYRMLDVNPDGAALRLGTPPERSYYLFCGHRGCGKSTELRSTAPVMGRPGAIWSLRSEHSGAFLRLQRLLDGRQLFTLCFLTYSDSAYRDEVADFLEERLGARVRVSIDPDDRIGTEALFEKLSAGRNRGPAQLTGLERWPEGLDDDLLGRLNHRRGALAERCARPLLMWIRSRDLRAVATRAADLWAWRSGVFDFVLPASPNRREPHRPHGWAAGVTDASRRRERIEELRQFLAKRPSLQPIDVDLLLDMGDSHESFGEMEAAKAAYLRARDALASMDDRRGRAITEGRIADFLEARGELGEALRIRTEEELPVYERLGDVRSRATASGNGGHTFL